MSFHSHNLQRCGFCDPVLYISWSCTILLWIILMHCAFQVKNIYLCNSLKTFWRVVKLRKISLHYLYKDIRNTRRFTSEVKGLLSPWVVSKSLCAFSAATLLFTHTMRWNWENSAIRNCWISARGAIKLQAFGTSAE